MDDTKRYERLRERFQNGDISRRKFFGLLGAAGAAYGLQMPFARQALAAGDVTQVRFDGWGGVVSEAFRKHAFDPYTAKTGIKVIDGTFPGGDEYLALVRASQPGEYNIAHLSGVFDYARYHSFDLTSELNLANIPNMANVMPALMNAFKSITPDSLSAAPYDYGTTGLAYNRKFISDDEMKEKGAKILADATDKADKVNAAAQKKAEGVQAEAGKKAAAVAKAADQKAASLVKDAAALAKKAEKLRGGGK